jgi:hypothetical protein
MPDIAESRNAALSAPLGMANSGSRAVPPSQSRVHRDADRSFRNPFAKLLENVHDRQSEDRLHHRRKPGAWA